MSFQLNQYNPPDFTQEFLLQAPDARLEQAPADTVAPENFHALSIFPIFQN